MALTAHQIAKRKTYIGASEIAGVCGLSKWSTPLSVYVDKKGLRDRRESIRFDVGHALEATIADHFCKRMDIDRKELKRSRFVRHPKEKIFGSTPDRFWPTCPDGPAVVQLKTVEIYAAADFGQGGTDEVKEEYLLQVLWEMYTAQVPVGYLAVLIGFADYRVYQLTWTPENKAILLSAIEKGRAWWEEHYAIDNPPPFTGKDADLEYIRECIAAGIPTGQILERCEEAEKLMRGDPDAPANSMARNTYEEIARLHEVITEEFERRKNGLRFKIGPADGIRTSLGVVSNAPNKLGVRTLRFHPIKLPGRRAV